MAKRVISAIVMVLIFIPILEFSGINEIEKIVNFIKTMHHISCAFEIESLFYNNDENIGIIYLFLYTFVYLNAENRHGNS